MDAYAHTAEEGGDESFWQPLSDHLEGVAVRAQAAAAMFDSDAWGRLA